MTDAPAGTTSPPLESGSRCAVLTGDIVGSSRLATDQRQALLGAMKNASQRIRDAFPATMPLPIDIFRGDSWQMLITQAHLCLRVAMFFRAFLRAELDERSIDTRMALAIGEIDLVPNDRVSEGEGSAFRASGRALTGMKRGVRLSFQCPDDPRSETWDSGFQLLDVIITRHWTPARSRAITGALQNWPQERIATLWPKPITQASVSNNLSGAAWTATEQFLDQFESAWRPAVDHGAEIRNKSLE